MKRYRVFVTGGTGAVGRRVCDRLLSQGHSVTVLSRRQPDKSSRVDVAVGQVQDLDDLRKLMPGHDAVIHLAAVSRPSLANPAELFATNSGATFNVFQAAADLGIKRVIQASSINYLGLFFGLRDCPPESLPIDERHNPDTTDAYSFSKSVVEEIGRFFWRRAGVSSLALRIPWIVLAEDVPRFVKMRQRQRQIVCDALALPAKQQQEWMAQHVQRFTEYKAAGKFENEQDFQAMWQDPPPIDLTTREIMNGRNNFWAALHEEDTAEAFALALDAETTGSQAVYVADDRNWLGTEAAQLARLCYPGAEIQPSLSDDQALVLSWRAKKLFGFQPSIHMADILAPKGQHA